MKKRVFLAILLTTGAMFCTYNLWHHTSILIFISILVLSFLLSHKLMDYVADFKTIKHNSRIDIAFLLIFFILLCIPASHISKAKKAKGENRYLAEKTTFINKKGLNLNFGKEFNEWFNDRFMGRSNLIQANIIMKCSVNQNYCTNNTISLYKKKNLLFRDTSYWGLTELDNNKEEILKIYLTNINKLQEFCDKNNIKLYILLVPRKAEFFDYPLADKRNYMPDPAEEIIDYLIKNTKTKIIYPKAAMKEANKETPVYYKTDHHWTKKGAYVGYYELMKEIKKDFPSVPILNEGSLEKYYNNKTKFETNQKFHNGYSFRQMKLPKDYAKKMLDTEYLYYNNPNKNKLKIIKNIAPIPEKGYSKLYDNQYFYPDGLNVKTLAITNSFGGNLFEFLPYSFKYTVRYYDNFREMKFEVYQDSIEKYKPDILIINLYTATLNKLLNLYPNNLEKENKQPNDLKKNK